MLYLWFALMHVHRYVYMRVGLHVCADICVHVFKWSLVHYNVRSLNGYNFIHHF